MKEWIYNAGILVIYILVVGWVCMVASEFVVPGR